MIFIFQFFDNIQVAMIVISFFFPNYLPEEYYQYRVPSVPNLTRNNGTVPSSHKPQEDPQYAPQGILILNIYSVIVPILNLWIRTRKMK